MTFLLSTVPIVNAQVGFEDELIYKNGNIAIYSSTRTDGSILISQYVDGVLSECATTIPGDSSRIIVTKYNDETGHSEEVPNLFQDVLVSPQLYSNHTARMGVISYTYSTDVSAGKCRAEVSYSYDTNPVQTTFTFRPVAYEVYSLAVLASMLISACSLLKSIVASSLASVLASTFGVAVSAGGYYFTTTGIPLSAQLTTYKFKLVNVDKATHVNSFTSNYYKITEEKVGTSLTEYWDNFNPHTCWRTQSFGAAVMAALWQYEFYSIDSWTYQ